MDRIRHNDPTNVKHVKYVKLSEVHIKKKHWRSQWPVGTQQIQKMESCRNVL